jgi:nucleotide-binding universal stress UspA family protein
MYKRIVLATDGSEHATRARAVEFALAKAFKAHRTFIVHGCTRVDEGRQILDEAESSAKEAGIRV